MSEIGDAFKALKEDGQRKRQENLSNSLAILISNGVRFRQLGPSHFRVGKFDFWPSTGKYLDRGTGKYGRGVFNLMKRVREVAR